MDRAGDFHRIPRQDDGRLAEVFARVVSHIPDRGQVMVRYYGLSANVHIIRHLKLTFAAEKPPPSHVFEPVALRAAEGSGDSE